MADRSISKSAPATIPLGLELPRLSEPLRNVLRQDHDVMRVQRLVARGKSGTDRRPKTNQVREGRRVMHVCADSLDSPRLLASASEQPVRYIRILFASSARSPSRHERRGNGSSATGHRRSHEASRDRDRACDCWESANRRRSDGSYDNQPFEEAQAMKVKRSSRT
jgi:hypothetical protein